MIDYRVCAVVVTYEPDAHLLMQLLEALDSQVARIVIVDNGSTSNASFGDFFNSGSVDWIYLPTNMGIGFAHNIGISYARRHCFDFVLLMDQDSVPASNMVEVLVAALIASGGCAVGPRYNDARRLQQPPFTIIKGLRLRRYSCDGADSVVAVDHLISSGCLFHIWAFDVVGLMREDLFIDNVDVEWGLRARHLGYKLYGVCGAAMGHSLGDEPIEFFGRRFVSHTPARHYYQFRNTVILLKLRWVPINWKIVYGWRLILKYLFYLVFSSNRLHQARAMNCGILHGIRGITGFRCRND